MYTAIVLTPPSVAAALDLFSWDAYPGYDTLAHHVTVNMGPHDTGPASHLPLGTLMKMEAYQYAHLKARVIALRVRGIGASIPTTNRVAHITLAVNRGMGGKPRMSNDIGLDAWKYIAVTPLCGTLQECE